MSAPDFLVHDQTDTVGVVVVEDIKAGQQLNGLVMENGERVTITALDDIPLGHKVALKDFAPEETVLKYGHDIGRTVAPIKTGQHLHVHNAKTKRW
jgi:(2R)-sulfolactate sulfo-lyase subunit alpha